MPEPDPGRPALTPRSPAGAHLSHAPETHLDVVPLPPNTTAAAPRSTYPDGPLSHPPNLQRQRAAAALVPTALPSSSLEQRVLPVPRPRPPQEQYDVTDPTLFWMNARPFAVHRSVGRGGFGEVYSVELLLPADGDRAGRAVPVCGEEEFDTLCTDAVDDTTKSMVQPRTITMPMRSSFQEHEALPRAFGVGRKNGVSAPDTAFQGVLSGAVPDSMKFSTTMARSCAEDGRVIHSFAPSAGTGFWSWLKVVRTEDRIHERNHFHLDITISVYTSGRVVFV